MKVIRRGTMTREPDGSVTLTGWEFDSDGKPIDLDELARLAIATPAPDPTAKQLRSAIVLTLIEGPADALYTPTEVDELVTRAMDRLRDR